MNGEMRERHQQININESIISLEKETKHHINSQIYRVQKQHSVILIILLSRVYFVLLGRIQIHSVGTYSHYRYDRTLTDWDWSCGEWRGG